MKLADLLREAKEEHTQQEVCLPTHDWADWYGYYLGYRLGGFERSSSANITYARFKENADV